MACEAGFLPRPDLRSLASGTVLPISNTAMPVSTAVGHNVATEAVCEEGACRFVRTQWIPEAEVERVAPAAIPGVELSMDALGQLQSGADANVSFSCRWWANTGSGSTARAGMYRVRSTRRDGAGVVATRSNRGGPYPARH